MFLIPWPDAEAAYQFPLKNRTGFYLEANIMKLIVAALVLVLSTSAMAVGGGGGKGGDGGGEGGDRVFDKAMQHLKAAQAAKK
ncbi:MAG: hypothetical protein E6Q24_14615 [Chitinophagaceae bacterium]|nr:MAG: hypothetical protein E6Q24_14615 [Chitinophagaceae bacterium]